jgi:CBS domain containing-hemolysin-like protein
MTLELWLLAICVIGSSISSGSETALVSASRIRIANLRSERPRRAAAAMHLLDHREQILIATLVVTNVLNIAAGAMATHALEQRVGSFGPLVATIVMTAVLLILSEITPKAFFRHHAEHMLLLFAPMWRIVAWIVAPVGVPIQFIFRLFGRDEEAQSTGLLVNKEAVRIMLEESRDEGPLDDHEQEWLQSTLDYSETIAVEVMVPIAEVAMVEESATTDGVLELVRERGYTRIPIYRGRVDQIVGLVNVYDILFDGDRKSFVRVYMRPARLVPDTKPIGDLFLEMQRARESLVVVVNEFGACIGVLSTEDIIEEIFGELSDEHEDDTPEIHELGPGHYRVNALSNVDDLNSEAGWSLPKTNFQSVGGYVLYRLGRIPRQGERFVDGNLEVRVVAADRFGVKQVEIREIPDPEAEAPD